MYQPMYQTTGIEVVALAGRDAHAEFSGVDGRPVVGVTGKVSDLDGVVTNAASPSPPTTPASWCCGRQRLPCRSALREQANELSSLPATRSVLEAGAPLRAALRRVIYASTRG
jgi:hypothetical protein